MTEAERHRIFRRRRATYAFLETLPPTCHWPKRPEPFRPQDSPLFAAIIESMDENGQPCDYVEAARILSSARNAGRILFDSETRLWRGSKWKAAGFYQADASLDEQKLLKMLEAAKFRLSTVYPRFSDRKLSEILGAFLFLRTQLEFSDRCTGLQ
jgi:hypothetical protein